jgi:hypothetical protein
MHGRSRLYTSDFAPARGSSGGPIIAAEPSAGNHQGKPSIGNRSSDRVKRVRSEEASSINSNRCLDDNDVHRQITQNHRQRGNGNNLSWFVTRFESRGAHGCGENGTQGTRGFI